MLSIFKYPYVNYILNALFIFKKLFIKIFSLKVLLYLLKVNKKVTITRIMVIKSKSFGSSLFALPKRSLIKNSRKKYK